MPTLTHKQEVEIDFEAYCTCGEGICDHVQTRNSHNREYPQIVVRPCETCLAGAREEQDDEIAELKSTIVNLEARIRELEEAAEE